MSKEPPSSLPDKDAILTSSGVMAIRPVDSVDRLADLGQKASNLVQGQLAPPIHFLPGPLPLHLEEDLSGCFGHGIAEGIERRHGKTPTQAQRQAFAEVTGGGKGHMPILNQFHPGFGQIDPSIGQAGLEPVEGEEIDPLIGQVCVGQGDRRIDPLRPAPVAPGLQATAQAPRPVPVRHDGQIGGQIGLPQLRGQIEIAALQVAVGGQLEGQVGVDRQTVLVHGEIEFEIIPHLPVDLRPPDHDAARHMRIGQDPPGLDRAFDLSGDRAAALCPVDMPQIDILCGEPCLEPPVEGVPAAPADRLPRGNGNGKLIHVQDLVGQASVQAHRIQLLVFQIHIGAFDETGAGQIG